MLLSEQKQIRNIFAINANIKSYQQILSIGSIHWSKLSVFLSVKGEGKAYKL